jgi:hypothetical protein
MATPTILIVPDRYKSGVLYSQLPESGAVDFGVTRATTAYRTNASGILESVASGVPRLDYPAAGGCPSLLVEPAATNLLQRSEEFDNAYWTKTETTASGNVGLAPDGTTTADLLTPNSTGTNRIIQRAFSATLVSGTVYTQSFFVKASGFQWVAVDGINGVAGAWFDLINGVIGTIAAGNTASIQSFGNGWYRCSVTRTAASTSGFVVLRLADADNSVTATASGSNGVLLWGAQLETGSVATSYIPTVAATATRNADVISKTGVSGFIGQTEGTLYAEVDLRNFVAFSRIIAISTGISTNRIELLYNTLGRISGLVIAGGVETAAISSAINQPLGVYKIAFAYAQDDFVLYINGNQIGTDTSGAVPATTKINIGSAHNDSSHLNDRIRAAAIYPTRLSNAELSALTSL